MINVTQTKLPSLNEYTNYLKRIWKTHWVTNDGEFSKELEKKLSSFLHVKNLALVNNGTSGLTIALRSLELKGEVITTPFTFPATVNVIIGENLKPVFADIDIETFNIDPSEIEKKITARTSAILAVHVYGNPCNMERLEYIAKKYKLKLIYDAAHAFNVKYKDKSILNFGDVSVLSFHATKVFNTIEGGAIILKNEKELNKTKLFRNFGIESEEKILLPGINAKMNEFQAIMGLLNLSTISDNLVKRKRIYELYKQKISDPKIKFQKIIASKYNYSYMPLVFESKKRRDIVYGHLFNNGVKARKYFYPLISNLKYVEKVSGISKVPNAKKISESVLCLPIYPDLSLKDVKQIVELINKA